MKLDLINSRIPVNLPPRVFDSSEMTMVVPNSFIKANSSISTISFKSKSPKIGFYPKSTGVPNGFNVALVNNKGEYVDIENNIESLKKKSLHQWKNDESIEPRKMLTIEDSPVFDFMKDKIHESKLHTIASRIESKQLPGAVWPKAKGFGVKEDVQPHLGPGCYASKDILQGNTDSTHTIKFTGGERDNQHLDLNNLHNLNTFPMEKRKRILAIKKAEQDIKISQSTTDYITRRSKSFNGISLLQLEPIFQHSLPSPTSSSLAKVASLDSNIANHTFSSSSRWNNTIYKQESYNRTSGLKLSHDYDKKLVETKIPFSFDKMSSRNLSLLSLNSQEVDVDVGHLYSMEHQVKTSPKKYSSAFRSSAPVGLEIPIPLSGVNAGPGSFPGAATPAIVIKEPQKNSYFLKRDRVFYIKEALPDDLNELKTFKDLHHDGPIFTSEGKNKGNATLQKRIRTKVSKIYPKLAKQIFVNKIYA